MPRAHAQALLEAPSEGRCWHADHRLAVSDGGGECGVDNMQTLCVVCHQRKTSEAQARRSAKRRRAGEQRAGLGDGAESDGRGATLKSAIAKGGHRGHSRF